MASQSVPRFTLRVEAAAAQTTEKVLFGCHALIRRSLLKKELFLRK